MYLYLIRRSSPTMHPILNTLPQRAVLHITVGTGDNFDDDLSGGAKGWVPYPFQSLAPF